MVKGPCKGCPDRTTGDRVTDCHTTCEKFRAYREAVEAEAEKRRLWQSVQSAIKAGHTRIKEVSYSSIHGSPGRNGR